MRACACMYVCAYVCMHVCMYACIYVCMYVCVCMYARMHVCGAIVFAACLFVYTVAVIQTRPHPTRSMARIRVLLGADAAMHNFPLPKFRHQRAVRLQWRVCVHVGGCVWVDVCVCV